MAGAALLGWPAERCLVIEDAPAGVAAGKAAGCTVLATLFSHTAEQLREADHFVETLEGVRMSHASGLLSLEAL